ncbi:DUF819 family protein [Fusobacterium perfoetens]|uniref:DUF819 family protein n=1 Tax=Fusobacterium perfoetens TaxID=852 RepID=UPI001F26C567|nr:DUF819 family protein [Fusobacterium perfoetens]MCF2625973.1 DUF819 family protein [Fusobacterium perfoetens]
MITTGFGYISFLLIFMAIVFIITDKYGHLKLFQVFPAILWIFVGMSLFATFGLFDGNSDSLNGARSMISKDFLPLMLCMFLLTCDVRQVLKLGPRMILAFFCGTISICIGFIVAFIVLKKWLPDFAWAICGAGAGTFIGDTLNMNAAAAALGVTGSDFAYCVLMDTFGYTIWFAFLLSTCSHAMTTWFNKKMKADTSVLEEIAARIGKEQEKKDNTAPNFTELLTLAAVAFAGAWITHFISSKMPTNSFMSISTWRVLISSLIGISLGMTRFHHLKSAATVANVFLYLSLANTASWSNLKECTGAPVFIIFCFIFLFVHLIGMLLASKIFKFDLFTAHVASMANIGGVSSAPIIAAQHNPNYISFGVLMGFIGNIVGTYVVLILAQILRVL